MTKRMAIFLFLVAAVAVVAQDKKPTTLREVLLAELKSTHNNEDWFVPANIAVKGLTAELARRQRKSLGRPTGLSPGVLEPAVARKAQGRAAREIQREQRRNVRQVRQQDLE